MSFSDLADYLLHMEYCQPSEPEPRTTIPDDTSPRNTIMMLDKSLCTRLLMLADYEYMAYMELVRRVNSCPRESILLEHEDLFAIRRVKQKSVLAKSSHISTTANAQLSLAVFEHKMSMKLGTLKTEGVCNFHHIFSIKEFEDRRYVVSQTLDYPTLAELLVSDCNCDVAFQIIYQVCVALFYANRRLGFVHNDISPQTVYCKPVNAVLCYPNNQRLGVSRLALITDYSCCSLNGQSYVGDVFKFLGRCLSIINPKHTELMQRLMSPFFGSLVGYSSSELCDAMFKYKFDTPDDIGVSGEGYIAHLNSILHEQSTNLTGTEYISTPHSRTEVLKIKVL